MTRDGAVMDAAAAGGGVKNTLLSPTDARRVMMLLTPGLVAPVASVWASHLYADQNGGGGSGANSARSSLDRGGPAATRFTVTRTEDALDSVLPSAPEAVIKRLGNSRFSNANGFRFNMA